jgi:hypothetical protein
MFAESTGFNSSMFIEYGSVSVTLPQLILIIVAGIITAVIIYNLFSKIIDYLIKYFD